MLEKTLESPLDCKEIQPIHSKGDQSWVFVGRTDAEAETPILWPPHAKSWLTGKDPDAGRDWGQEEKGTTEDEMAGWHHWHNGPQFEWTELNWTELHSDHCNHLHCLKISNTHRQSFFKGLQKQFLTSCNYINQIWEISNSLIIHS